MTKMVSGTHKRVVLVYWKNKSKNQFEVFSNLKNFCLSYKNYSYNTLNNYLSKAKTEYENDVVRVERKQILFRPVKRDVNKKSKRSIVPVVRRVAMKEANDEMRDIAYWLDKSPSERMLAVKMLNAQLFPKQSRMDKTQVVKIRD